MVDLMKSKVESRQSKVDSPKSGVHRRVLLLVACALVSLASAASAQSRGGIASFPAQQRDPDDPALVARGRAAYDTECRSCHGPDLRGGEAGGPNLLRSQVMLNDRSGEMLQPILDGSHKARISAAGLSPEDVRAVAAHIHSVLALAPGQGAPPPGPPSGTEGPRRRCRGWSSLLPGEVWELPFG